MFIELNEKNEFVQYHKDERNVSKEHVENTIEATEELYEKLKLKMPWYLEKLTNKKIYDISDLIYFKEIIVQHEPNEIEKRVDVLENENADLLIDAAVKDSKINLLENDLADLMIEIASMGGLK